MSKSTLRTMSVLVPKECWDENVQNTQRFLISTHSRSNLTLCISIDRLVLSLDWSPGPTKSRGRGETGTLGIKSYSGLAILLSDPIVSFIGQSDGEPNCLLHRHHANACTSVGWTHAWIAISPMIVAEYFPQSRSLKNHGASCFWGSVPQSRRNWK